MREGVAAGIPATAGWLPVRRLQAHARMSACRDATRGRRRGEPLAGDAGALGEDGDAPIEALVDLNGSLRVTAALRPGQELDVVRAEGDRVVVADDAAVLEAEDCLRVKPGRPRAIRGRGIGRRLGKARIVAGQESAQEGVRPVAVGNARQAQFRAQPILKVPNSRSTRPLPGMKLPGASFPPAASRCSGDMVRPSG